MEHNLSEWPLRELYVDELDEVFGEKSSESEEDVINVDSHDSGESESDSEEWESTSLQQRLLQSRARGHPNSKWRGKNGYEWHTNIPEGRPSQAPVIIPGPCNAASQKQTIEEFFDILFTDDIINIIVVYTNKEIEKKCLRIIENGNELEQYHNTMDIVEMKAFIGLLYYSGLWKSSRVGESRLWKKSSGQILYRCTMSKNRYTFIAACLRFDDKKTRNRDDRFAPIRTIWEIFMNNCRQNYEPHSLCTVGKQLLGFKGRCSFRVHMKTKADKCGIKIISLNDAHTSYMINGIPYLGKVHHPPNDESMPEYFFREVTVPIHGTHRSVTCDNWFNTIPMMQRMLCKPFNLTVTGTLRKNEKEIPSEMIVAATEIPGSKFCFSHDMMLVSHTPRRNKIVLVASTYMMNNVITNSKPDVIRHYNRTVGATDDFDQMCHNYSTARRTRRWPLRFFFGILDQAAVNARILMITKLQREKNEKQITAVDCLSKIYMHLMKPHLERRYEITTIPTNLRNSIGDILSKNNKTPKVGKKLQFVQRKRCALCKSKDDRKTKKGCVSCERPMCDYHRLPLCTDCGAMDY